MPAEPERSKSEAADCAAAEAAGRVPWETHERLRVVASLWGVAAALALLGFYAVVLGLANSFAHALEDFIRLWPWMAALTTGFAVQVGLFTYARRAARDRGEASARGMAASGGTSAASMVACCAHHLTDVLPLIGLTGAAFFLAAYQSLFLLLGVLANLVGVVFMLGQIRKHRLVPDRPSLLTVSASWPADRAVPYVFGASAFVFGWAFLLAIR